jgi:hypothetical protein
MTRARGSKCHAHSIRSTGLNNRLNPNTVITGTVVMEGQRDGGVYSTPMSQPATLPRVPTGSISGTASLATNATKAYELKIMDALINYYHMTLGSPPISEWINCINKSWFKSWIGLSADRVRKFCNKKEQTT